MPEQSVEEVSGILQPFSGFFLTLGWDYFCGCFKLNKKLSIRKATANDCTAIDALMREAGFKYRSPQGWDWLLKQNPAFQSAGENMPFGWVVASDDDIFGYLSNLPLDYACKGQYMRAVTCGSYYVRPEGRSRSTFLMAQYFRQKNVDIFLTTTANEISGALYAMFKGVVSADPALQQDHVWFTDNRVLLEYFLSQIPVVGTMAAPAVLSAAAKVLAPLAQGIQRLARLSMPPPSHFDGEIVELEINAIGGDFDRLWQRLREQDALVARRDAKILRWQMSDPDTGSTPCLFAAKDQNGIAGYAIGARHQAGINELARFNVMDIAVRPGVPDTVIENLMHKLADRAAKSDAGLLALSGCATPIARRTARLRPFIRKRNISSHYVRVKNPALAGAAERNDFWHSTSLDGDRPLFLRDIQKERRLPATEATGVTSQDGVDI